jgi:L-ascorbate metabolism protein UlaG (beta-lactamase superfamily)
VVNITFLGHSAVSLEADGKTLLVDPFLSGNPQAAVQASELNPDAIYLTHGHDDHVGDGVNIAQRTGCLVVACFELATYCQKHGCEAHPMHIGGKRDFGWFTLKLTPALHGSAKMSDPPIYMGNPTGGIITLGGRTIYHPGDTGLMMDMELIGRLHKIDLAFLPIGDNFTMGIDDAVEAVKMIKPAQVVPIHFNTFDVIEADPDEFAEKVGDLAEVTVLVPGESMELA